ncbi:type 1 glutamine amidotransferase [soil metagenome]
MNVLRICILVHGPGTRPEALVDWAFDRGHAVDVRYLFKGEELPALTEFDWLISTGGPMHAFQDDKFPFLGSESTLIAQAVSANKAVLGLCLGSQLMARALGAGVKKNEHWEVGWHRVQIDDPNLGKGDLMAFQWHQDTFELPKGARLIATNTATPNQGFRLSARQVGVQFHPEAIHEWVQGCATDPDYPTGPYVQMPSELVQGLIHQPAMNYWLRRLLQQIEGDL